MRCIFGPVPSRRLGRSLGVDVIPPKTCSYDCLYCESGPTTHLTVVRQAFIDPDSVLRELLDFLSAHPRELVDVLTFSSAGEPTLYEPLGELIHEIKGRFPGYPLVVLTNGSLLWDESVRRALLEADRVVPSLDAVTEDVFRCVSRPHTSLDLFSIIEGLKAFRKEYRGELCVEVLLVNGVNDSEEHLRALRRALDAVQPDAVELNTVDRPPAYAGIRGLDADALRRAAGFFPCGKTRVVGHFQHSGSEAALLEATPLEAAPRASLDERILELLTRRPCTSENMAGSLGATIHDVEEVLAGLQERGKVAPNSFGERPYYQTVKGGQS